jgi:maltose alpha-D-glucosyltransferase/alpha-amylase
LHLTLGFFSNAFLTLALAEENGNALREAFTELPWVPNGGQWANFLRNLDELNLQHLSPEQRERVYQEFAPDPGMRLYGRGIRRRLAPMLGGDVERLKLAFSLLLSIPGVPLIVYGDEIGMGEDLSLPGRDAVRAPFPWNASKNGGFSEAAESNLFHPVISQGPFSFEHVNAAQQLADDQSLLRNVRQMIDLRKQYLRDRSLVFQLLPCAQKEVSAHFFDGDGGGLLAVHNLSGRPVHFELEVGSPGIREFTLIHGRGSMEKTDDRHFQFQLERYGHLWAKTKS